MDVKSPLNLAEPCQHDGHQEGLLCFDQHQCAWEHIPDQRHHLCQCVSAPARPQEPGRDLTHLPFCLKPKISFCTKFIWRGDWRCAVTQVVDTVFSKMDQVWVCILEIQAFFPRALYTSCCFRASKRNLDFSCFLIFPIVFKICCFVFVLVWHQNQCTCCFPLSRLLRGPPAPLQITNGCQSPVLLCPDEKTGM